jgi:CheY-like chemotaxis protein
MPETNAIGSPQPAEVRVLLVEDDPLIRFAMAEALRDLGVTVIEASTADEAWEYLKTETTVDLVFTDHRMPGSMSGAELARRIRKAHPAMMVIVTSGDWDDADWTEPVLRKPYGLFDTASRLATLAESNHRKRIGS